MPTGELATATIRREPFEAVIRELSEIADDIGGLRAVELHTQTCSRRRHGLSANPTGRSVEGLRRSKGDARRTGLFEIQFAIQPLEALKTIPRSN
jgi:hypothetical protein